MRRLRIRTLRSLFICVVLNPRAIFRLLCSRGLRQRGGSELGGSNCERLLEALARLHVEYFSGTRFQSGKPKQGSNISIRGRGALW